MVASQFGTAWEEFLNFDRLRASRLDRLEKAMKRDGLDAVVVFRHDNIRYLTGYRPLMWETGYVTRNAAIYPRGSRPVILAHAGDLDRAKTGMPWMREGELLGLGSMEDPGIARTIVNGTFRELVQAVGASHGRIGLDGTTFFTTTFLREALPEADWTDANPTMRRAREVKSEDEVRLISVAAEIAEGGLRAALEHVDSDGVTDQEIAAEGVRAIFRLGAEYLPSNPIVASGTYAETYYPLAAQRFVTPGFIVLDFSAMHDGYCARIARTAFIGQPSPEQQRLYQTVHRALQRGIEACQARTPASSLASLMGGFLSEEGLDGYAYGRGFGVGLSLRESPFVREDSSDSLVPGMAVALEVGAHVPGRGGVRLCDTVVVTEAGTRLLTRLAFDEKLLGGIRREALWRDGVKR
ncbi:MAG TPA: Xaa-Pro peptidase family protein [Thermoleophilia bacterium]|nr:Xaa-Pro peptidase family protein [Thermoleophilia bacterium]